MATSRVWKEEGGQKLVFNDLDLVARRLGGGGGVCGGWTNTKDENGEADRRNEMETSRGEKKKFEYHTWVDR